MRHCLALLLLAHAASASWTGRLGLTFESSGPIEQQTLHCPSGFITGIRVRYGRTKQARQHRGQSERWGGRAVRWSGK